MSFTIIHKLTKRTFQWYNLQSNSRYNPKTRPQIRNQRSNLNWTIYRPWTSGQGTYWETQLLFIKQGSSLWISMSFKWIICEISSCFIQTQDIIIGNCIKHKKWMDKLPYDDFFLTLLCQFPFSPPIQLLKGIYPPAFCLILIYFH